MTINDLADAGADMDDQSWRRWLLDRRGDDGRTLQQIGDLRRRLGRRITVRDYHHHHHHPYGLTLS